MTKKIELYACNRRMCKASAAMRRQHAENSTAGVHHAFVRLTHYGQQHQRRALARYDQMLAAGLREIISF